MSVQLYSHSKADLEKAVEIILKRHRILSPMNFGSKYRTMAYFGDFIAILTIIINQNKPVKTAICCTYVVPII